MTSIPKKRVLVLGANGMLGRTMIARLARQFNVAGTVRHRADGAGAEAFNKSTIFGGVSADDIASVRRVLDDFRPEIIVNCIGIVKQLPSAHNAVQSITANALFPHQVADLAGRRGMRSIHFSTDCIFSGAGGPYFEDSPPDPVDLYGRSKWLGEVVAENALTLRTSFVGHAPDRATGLLDWFEQQRQGTVNGYVNALYTGLTADVLADVCARIVSEWPDLWGIWHVSGEAISKFELLGIVNRIYGLGITIDEDRSFQCDRRLDSTRFRSHTGWSPPSWEQMIAALRERRLNAAAMDEAAAGVSQQRSEPHEVVPFRRDSPSDRNRR